MKPAAKERLRPFKVGRISDVPLKSEDEQRVFFQASLDRALMAQAKVGTVERWFEVAGAALRVCFAGERLVECLVPALAHLEVPARSRADAVFHVWDGESTGVAMVPPICAKEHFSGRGDIWGMASRRFKSNFLWAEAAVALMDVETATGVYWTHTASVLPFWAKASPLRNLLHWWTESKGFQLVHGAAVGRGGEGVLITGKGGLGKSTAALACLDAGLEYIGDDYLVVELGPVPRVHSLYCTGKLNWDQMARFPRLGSLARSHGSPLGEKAVMYLHPAMDRQLPRVLILKAILTPDIVDHPATTFSPVSAPVLERAAGFTTMTQLPHVGRHTTAFIARLVAGLPGLRLELGSDLAAIPKAIETLLALPPAAIAALARPAPAVPVADRPVVSAIVPVRDGARFLPDALASIQAQNYSALEIIVVDDGSRDDIEEVLRRLPAAIRYMRQEPSGPAAARNRGILAAKGELIAFLDVDDLWPPDNLNLMVDAMSANPARDVVQGYPQIMREMADSGQYEFIGSPRDIFPDYLGAALYRRSAFDKVGMLDETLMFGEDIDWFYRARECGLAIERLEQISLLVRRHDRNMTRDQAAEDFASKLLQKILRRKRASRRGLAPS